MKKTLSYTRSYWVVGIVFFILGLLFIYPLLFNISASFRPTSDLYKAGVSLIPKNITLNHYHTVLENVYFVRWYANTFLLTILTLVTRLAVVTTAAYGFSRLEFRFKELLFLIILSTMMVTPDTTIVPRYLQYRSMGILNTWWVIILPDATEVYFLFLLRQFFTRIPKSLSESATIDGAGHWKIFSQIIVPMSKPALMTVIIFTFVWSWNDFINPFIFIRSPELQNLSVGLQYFRGQQGANVGAQMAAATLAIIPIAILFAVTQRVFVENLSSSGIKG